MRAPGQGPGRSALTILRPPPVNLATQKADYFASPGAIQVVNLSFVPEKDVALAQLRVILPSGLRFGDEVNTGDKPKEPSAARSRDKAETARVLWRGAALKGVAIENAVEFKTVSQGRHAVLLTLETLDGKPLQTKAVLFQVEEVQTPEKPKVTPDKVTPGTAGETK